LSSLIVRSSLRLEAGATVPARQAGATPSRSAGRAAERPPIDRAADPAVTQKTGSAAAAAAALAFVA
jgi:hypothetical protein